MVILVYPNVRNVVVSGQWENNCSNNVPGVLINTQIINIFSSWIRTTNFWKYGSISWDKMSLGQVTSWTEGHWYSLHRDNYR